MQDSVKDRDWLLKDANGMYYVDLSKIRERTNRINMIYLPKEQIWVNKKVAVLKTKEDILNEIPFEWIEENKKFYGKLTNMSMDDPVRNTNWDFVFFKNVQIFKPAANAFKRFKDAGKGVNSKPAYTHALKGTTAYNKFWEEEFLRIKYGYEPIIDDEPCGIRISGEFYFYLNYCLIDMLNKNSAGQEVAVTDFPLFLSMDYYWFKELESRENPSAYGFPPEHKRSISCVKTRRAGFSYKEACGCVWVTAFENKSRVAIASAPDSKKPDATVAARKCLPIIDQLSSYTPFGVQNIGDPKFNGGWKNELSQITDKYFSYTFGIYNTKTKEKRGRQSCIFTITLSKADAAAGEGLRRLYFEEAGKIDNLAEAWVFSRETMKVGSLFRGVSILFGTGGEMISHSGKEGKTKSFSEIHYNPEVAELASYDNIYEYKVEEGAKCGWFVSSLWCHFGAGLFIQGKRYDALDEHGNAIFWVAELCLNKERKEKEPPKGKLDEYNRYLTQKCITASEAFLITQSSVFQTADLIALQSKIRMHRGGFAQLRQPGTLVRMGGTIKFLPDLDKKLSPITTLKEDTTNKEGCLLLYEEPQKINGLVPEDAYIISIDPIGMDNSAGSSMISILVMKTPKYYEAFGPKPIVATYVGRYREKPMTYATDLLINLSEFYNAKITFENDRDGGIPKSFADKGRLSSLLGKPLRVLSKNGLANSKTLQRELGHSMGSTQAKHIGEQYTYDWLATEVYKAKEYSESGDVISEHRYRNLDLLEDEFLIEQLISYNRHGNFDSALALFGGCLQLKEHYNLEIETPANVHKLNDELFDFWNSRINKKSPIETKYQKRYENKYNKMISND